VVVLSYGLWQRRFGGNPAIVGKSLSLGNDSYMIVGVIGKEFLSDRKRISGCHFSLIRPATMEISFSE